MWECEVDFPNCELDISNKNIPKPDYTGTYTKRWLEEVRVHFETEQELNQEKPDNLQNQYESSMIFDDQNLSYADKIKKLRTEILTWKKSGRFETDSFETKLELFKQYLRAYSKNDKLIEGLAGKLSSFEKSWEKLNKFGNYDRNFSKSKVVMTVYESLFFDNPPDSSFSNSFYVCDLESLKKGDSYHVNPNNINFVLEQVKTWSKIVLEKWNYNKNIIVQVQNLHIIWQEWVNICWNWGEGSAMIMNADWCTVENINFKNTPTNALQMKWAWSKALNCDFENVQTWILCVWKNSIIDWCNIDWYSRDWILCWADSVKIMNNEIINCRWEYWAVHPDWIQFFAWTNKEEVVYIVSENLDNWEVSYSTTSKNPYSWRFSSEWSLSWIVLQGNRVEPKKAKAQWITAFQCHINFAQKPSWNVAITAKDTIAYDINWERYIWYYED